MEVQLTEDQRDLVRRAIETGRLKAEEDALREALLLWEERERRRAEILAAVEQSEASLARNPGRRVTTREEAHQLAGDIKRRGLSRLESSKGRR